MSKFVESERFQVEEIQFLGAGAEHWVTLVKIILGGRKEIFLARKSHYVGGMILGEHGAYIHSILSKRGYPVPLTWRYDPAAEETYVTDLTQRGKSWVIDIKSKRKYGEGKIENITQLEKEINDIAQRAAQDGLIISADAYFCVVDKTGRGKIVLGDLGGVWEEPSPERKKRLAEENLRMASFFLAKIIGRS